MVIQVKAQVGDSKGDKLNPAGQIEYSIVSTHKHFKIDSETGCLSTNTVRVCFLCSLLFRKNLCVCHSPIRFLETYIVLNYF